ncbi:MAG: sulfurtransferase [Planctomycetaceae bacterium]|nr:sulfurtransferase [Planctomycetaceae bacterium]
MATNYADPNVLVTTDWALENLETEGIRFVEIDVDNNAFDAGHIPGSVGINWATELNDPVNRDIVSREQLEALLSRHGIQNDDTLILYGDNNNWFAAFGFWILKLYGHENVKLMNGGRVKWLNEDDKPLTTDQKEFSPTQYSAPEMDSTERALVMEVMQLSASGTANLVDVRSPDEFTGKVIAPPGMTETAQRGGHVPGAANVPWSTAVNQDDTFKSLDELKQIYLETAGVDPSKPTVAYCRIGERSSHTWFVLKYLLGLTNVKNYDGSWTEYGNLIGAPIERPTAATASA